MQEMRQLSHFCTEIESQFYFLRRDFELILVYLTHRFTLNHFLQSPLHIFNLFFIQSLIKFFRPITSSCLLFYFVKTNKLLNN